MTKVLFSRRYSCYGSIVSESGILSAPGDIQRDPSARDIELPPLRPYLLLARYCELYTRSVQVTPAFEYDSDAGSHFSAVNSKKLIAAVDEKRQIIRRTKASSIDTA